MGAAEVSDFNSFSAANVVARILETAYGDSRIADSRLSRELSSQFRDYLSAMTKNELLEYDGASRTYKMTRKGQAFLRTYREMGEFIDLIQEEIGL